MKSPGQASASGRATRRSLQIAFVRALLCHFIDGYARSVTGRTDAKFAAKSLQSALVWRAAQPTAFRALGQPEMRRMRSLRDRQRTRAGTRQTVPSAMERALGIGQNRSAPSGSLPPPDGLLLRSQGAGQRPAMYRKKAAKLRFRRKCNYAVCTALYYASYWQFCAGANGSSRCRAGRNSLVSPRGATFSIRNPR